MPDMTFKFHLPGHIIRKLRFKQNLASCNICPSNGKGCYVVIFANFDVHIYGHDDCDILNMLIQGLVSSFY